jgi:glycosyltransferase involved in cell wall biosynthesis
MIFLGNFMTLRDSRTRLLPGAPLCQGRGQICEMNSLETPLCAVTGGLMLGGSSTFLVNLSRAFGERGLHLPIVVLHQDNGLARDFAQDAPISLISRRRHIYEDRLALAYEEIARWRPRAVLACLGGESFEVLRLVPRGVARFGIIQSDDPGPYGVIPIYASWLDGMVGVSNAICEKMQRFPEMAKRRVVHIPYGIRFGPVVPRTQTKSDQPLRLIYVGRIIEEQKRVSRLAELVKSLDARGFKFEFTFVGTGPQLPALQAALAAIPSAHFQGEVPNHAVGKLLETQDVFVLLSDYEGLPLSLLEAMGAGAVPVVSDLESGIRDVVVDQAGVRVPIGDVEAAANVIAALAQNREGLAAMSAAAARQVREEYSAANMAERYLQLIDEFPRAAVEWPSTASVPVPFGVKPWLYQGAPRHARRWIKRVIAAARGSSSRS